MSRTIKENVQAFAVKQVLNYLDEDPEKSLPKILDWVEKYDKTGRFDHMFKPFHAILDDPCPMLENPQCLRDMVNRSGAHSTDMQSPENIDDLYARCKPYADRWAPKADELWTASHGCAGCGK